MSRRTRIEATEGGRFTKPPRDPRVRAFCDALAEAVAVGVVAELSATRRFAAAGSRENRRENKAALPLETPGEEVG